MAWGDDPAKVREYKREWRRKNLEKARASERAREQRRRLARYGLTQEQYTEMRTRQEGGCAICRSTLTGGKAECIDHCHRTGKVRSILCHPCNAALGLARESKEILQSMIGYLEVHHA